jgi:HEAT repeat protein
MKTLVRSSLLCLAMSLLGAAQAQEVRELVRQLGDKDSSVRRRAASALIDVGPEAKAAVPSLARALKDPDTYVRRFSAQALGKIGPDARAAVPALGGALKDDKREVAEAAAEALGKIRSGASKPLADAVKDKGTDADVRRKAAEALAELGPEARLAVPVLIAALKDNEVRVQAAVALGAIGPDAKSALPALKTASELKGNRNREFKQAASQALRKIQAK